MIFCLVSWRPESVYELCEILLQNLHNNSFYVLFACWWLLVEPKHFPLNNLIYKEKVGTWRYFPSEQLQFYIYISSLGITLSNKL